MRCLFTLAPASTSEGHSVRRSGADSELLDNDFGWGSFSDNLWEDVSNNYRSEWLPIRNGSRKTPKAPPLGPRGPGVPLGPRDE